MNTAQLLQDPVFVSRVRASFVVNAYYWLSTHLHLRKYWKWLLGMCFVLAMVCTVSASIFNTVLMSERSVGLALLYVWLPAFYKEFLFTAPMHILFGSRVQYYSSWYASDRSAVLSAMQSIMDSKYKGAQSILKYMVGNWYWVWFSIMTAVLVISITERAWWFVAFAMLCFTVFFYAAFNAYFKSME